MLRRLSPHAVASYVKSLGWRRIPTASAVVFGHPDAARYDQVVIPGDTQLDDYAERMAEIIVKLAADTGLPVMQVAQDAMLPSADTIRFAWEGAEADAGSIGFVSSIDLLKGAKQALLSAACTAIRPAAHHPRMALTEAEALINSSRLNHTEHGSFVVSVTCPLPPIQQSLLGEQDTPFVRKATTILMQSADRLVRAIERSQLDGLLSQDPNDGPVISANLCDAILGMQPEGNDALRIAASWAPTLPIAAGLTIPRLVRIRKEYLPTIEGIRDQLRPAREIQSTTMVGTVKTLNGVPGDDGRQQGEVSLIILHDDEPLRVRVELDADRYAVAIQAHQNNIPVHIEGVLKLGKRSHQVQDLRSFSTIDRTS